MPSRAGFKLRTLGTGDSSAATSDESTRGFIGLLLWLLRNGSDDRTPLPVRVFYKFDSGSWRCRSTHQLQKVYRCR